ncbi:hypothetical protein LOZ65_004360 [Ophidiomyces ophidiicola]|nr:hypothetical protein LOZ65_004360 [Ophidiomyces ophidiicola]
MFSTKSKEKAPYIEYRWINGVETLERYRPGGYHPVVIGNLLHVVSLVVKVGVADSRPHETRILRQLSAQDPPSSSTSTTVKSSKGRDLIPVLLDEFKIKGPNGIHPCYTMTPAQCNLREASYKEFQLLSRSLLYFFMGVAISMEVSASKDVLVDLALAIADIHLRNVLAKLPSSFDELSVDQFYEKYGKVETVPV